MEKNKTFIHTSYKVTRWRQKKARRSHIEQQTTGKYNGAGTQRTQRTPETSILKYLQFHSLLGHHQANHLQTQLLNDARSLFKSGRLTREQRGSGAKSLRSLHG
jgi:hypothetical protein